MKTKEVDISKSITKMYCCSIRVTVFVVLALLRNSEQSIAGITYMDNFEFESRYRDIHECDPFYWHPLHLPEYCADMYETLIRSKIGSKAPVRVATKKKKLRRIHKSHRKPVYETRSSENADPVEFSYESNMKPQISLEPFNFDFSELYYKQLSPYQKMLEMLRRDVLKNPSAPVISNFPLFGPVAVYNQPISRRSESLIKKIASVYANAEIPTGNNHNYYGEIDIRRPVGGDDPNNNNNTQPDLEIIEKEKDNKKFNHNQKGLEPQRSRTGNHRHRPKVVEKILPNGAVITVIKQNT